MSEPIDYHQLRATKVVRRRFSSEVGRARSLEHSHRNGTARSRALGSLAKAFPDEYRALYLAALAEVNAERGPLPGDEGDAA